mmetsp:Transcript_11911/g.21216  ORF Transcript_11911/g.21216 Transcript_11911/m.21216 type:complete len:380 (+) Transcript_11911:87-1226(+)
MLLPNLTLLLLPVLLSVYCHGGLAFLSAVKPFAAHSHQLFAHDKQIVADGVPTIDIASLWEEKDSERRKECINKISEACEAWGFFQISNHQVPQGVIDNMYDQMRSFFYLPLEEKYTIKRTADNSRGFYDDELTKQTRDWKQGLDLGNPAREAAPGMAQDGWNQWPNEDVLPEFRTAMETYYACMEDLSAKLMQAIEEGLVGAEAEGVFAPAFEGHSSYLRLNYYPLCPDPGAHLGINRHTDAGALTVLLQDRVSALQVNKDGAWVGVRPAPGTFTINVGDMLQVWSNGKYKAPEHRVLANPAMERFSAPFFYNPAYAADVAPLPGLLGAAGGARYAPVNWGHFRLRRFQGDFADVGTEIQIADFLLPGALAAAGDNNY